MFGSDKSIRHRLLVNGTHVEKLFKRWMSTIQWVFFTGFHRSTCTQCTFALPSVSPYCHGSLPVAERHDGLFRVLPTKCCKNQSILTIANCRRLLFLISTMRLGFFRHDSSAAIWIVFLYFKLTMLYINGRNFRLLHTWAHQIFRSFLFNEQERIVKKETSK